MHPLEILIQNGKMWGYSLELAILVRCLDFAKKVPSFSLVPSFRQYEWVRQSGESEKVVLEGTTLFLDGTPISLDFIPPEVFAVVGAGLISLLPRRDVLSHKGDMGSVLVIGGSKRYSGAPILCALGALYSGTDVVMLHSKNENVISGVANIPSIIPVRTEFLEEALSRANAVVIGPGMTPSDAEEYAGFISRMTKPVVFDAGALELSNRIKSGKIITPHAGEYRRMFNEDVDYDIKSRITKCLNKSIETNSVIVLKGPLDIITYGKKCRINITGTPEMTIGGTGDVLAGIIGGICAQGVDPFSAAQIGCFLNGLAARLFLERNSINLLVAHEYPKYILDGIREPQKFSQFLRERVSRLASVGYNIHEISGWMVLNGFI
ncbi:MAG: NAD(P)H-hydrate dehydratase [Candidatus Korarchaeota archaeon]